MNRRTVHFSGHVQGVGFRFLVLQMSRRFSVLRGFVRNLSDGRVEMVVEGPDGSITEFIEEVKERMSGYIDSSDERVDPATGEFRSFEIRR
ncbi:MAG: acylphosphatase [Tepidisphaeraceae bacterium]